MYANRPLNVLLFEETKFMGAALKESMEAAGHRVTWVKGVLPLNKLYGVRMAEEEGAAEEVLAINPRKFDFAVVAGGLEYKTTGMQVAKALTANKLPSLGLSTGEDMTKEFAESGGATIVANKAPAYQALFDRSFDLRGAIRSPQTVQAHLDDLTGKISADRSIMRDSNKRLMALVEKVGT
jgi:hypothetical protein